jgi:tripartite-type tricarboxylate transporter receptor subunit TctC
LLTGDIDKNLEPGSRPLLRDVLEKAEAKAAFAKISYEIAGVSRADFARLIKDDFERWGPIVKASGFTVLD